MPVINNWLISELSENKRFDNQRRVAITSWRLTTCSHHVATSKFTPLSEFFSLRASGGTNPWRFSLETASRNTVLTCTDTLIYRDQFLVERSAPQPFRSLTIELSDKLKRLYSFSVRCLQQTTDLSQNCLRTNGSKNRRRVAITSRWLTACCHHVVNLEIHPAGRVL